MTQSGKHYSLLWQKEKLLVLSQCFLKTSAADASECVYKWERVKFEICPVDLANVILKMKCSFYHLSDAFRLLCL